MTVRLVISTDRQRFGATTIRLVVSEMVTQRGDRNRIIRIVEPVNRRIRSMKANLKVNTVAEHKRTVVFDKNRKTKEKVKKRRRSCTSSSFGSSSRSRSFSTCSDNGRTITSSSESKYRKRKSESPFELVKFPFEARKLPRPHEFVFSKARFGPNGKAKKEKGSPEYQYSRVLGRKTLR